MTSPPGVWQLIVRNRGVADQAVDIVYYASNDYNYYCAIGLDHALILIKGVRHLSNDFLKDLNANATYLCLHCSRHAIRCRVR